MQALVQFILSTWYFWVLVILAAVYSLFKPVIKGFLGEKSVSYFLSRLDKKQYRIINDLILEKERGTTQIDHVIVSVFGVFVIETKNYKGWILGGEHDENWTQVIYKHKEKIHNPLRQNYGHVLALKRVLESYPGLRYFPIVAISPVADIKVKTDTPVVYFHKLVGEIKKQSTPTISAENCNKIYEQLTALQQKNTGFKSEHVQSVKAEVGERARAVNAGLCPKCGGTLVQRSGKYGAFTGCSNFPKCRFIAK